MDTCKVCTKCKANNISELVWVNQVTGEIEAREDQFYCHDCNAKVEVIITAAVATMWFEDITPLTEDNANSML